MVDPVRIVTLQAQLRRALATAAIRQFLERRRATQRVEVVPTFPLNRGAAQVCTVCNARDLPSRVGHTPAYSDVTAKRRLREAFVAFVRDHAGPSPLVLVVDAWLPLTEHDPSQGTYLTEDLLAGVPGLSPERILSPNVDPTVVEDLRHRCGLAHAANRCCCLFLERRRDTIRALGGFGACMLDVWGGFEHGTGLPHRGTRDPGPVVRWVGSHNTGCYSPPARGSCSARATAGSG